MGTFNFEAERANYEASHELCNLTLWLADEDGEESSETFEGITLGESTVFNVGDEYTKDGKWYSITQIDYE